MNRELVLKFLILFSAFECALKMVGFVKQPQSEKQKKAYHQNKFLAQPDWETFSTRYSDDFNANEPPELKKAWDYFVNAPPRKQILKNNEIDLSGPYAYANTEKELVWLLKSVKIVRNNLFHGGKYPFVEIKEPARNVQLLELSIEILKSCLPLDNDVNSSVRRILEDASFTL